MLRGGTTSPTHVLKHLKFDSKRRLKDNKPAYTDPTRLENLFVLGNCGDGPAPTDEEATVNFLVAKVELKARTTEDPKEMWAMQQSNMPTPRPRAPLGSSTESDWNALLRTLDNEGNGCELGVIVWNIASMTSPISANAEENLPMLWLRLRTTSRTDPVACTRRAFDAFGIAADSTLGGTHTMIYCQVRRCLDCPLAGTE
jgi:hypothetical protein